MNQGNEKDVVPEVFYVVIDVRNHETDPLPIEGYMWDNMSFSVRTKWNWYFRYRAALLQVKYPKLPVSFRWGHRMPDDPNAVKLSLERRIRAKKAKITEMKNKIIAAENHFKEWMIEFDKENEGLLIKKDPPKPVQETDFYKWAMAKIERLEQELIDMQKERESYE